MKVVYSVTYHNGDREEYHATEPKDATIDSLTHWISRRLEEFKSIPLGNAVVNTRYVRTIYVRENN